MSSLPKPLRFVPYDELGDMPNIIVDGAAQDGTVLTLSHWPISGTPEQLKRDTSAEIAFVYVDTPEVHVDVEVVSNNHFDQDGLIGLFILVNPQTAQQYRELLIDAASAGDFGVYENRNAARISFTLYALTDPSRSFLSRSIFDLPNEKKVAALYIELLAELPKILTDIESYKNCWESEEKHLLFSTELINNGAVVIEEKPELDLASVRIPVDSTTSRKDQIPVNMDSLCHPYAIYSSTLCNRVLLICGNAFEFRYRYESWVQLVTRRPLPRVSLNDLVEQLNRIETSGGEWVSDGVDQITPNMTLTGSNGSSIPEPEITCMLQDYLANQPGAWNPYG